MPIRRKLGFESLEAREVCAGDASVTVVGGELRVLGDNAANFVNIQRQFSGGELKFIVTGVPFRGQFDADGNPIAATSGNDATFINGQAGPQEFSATRVNISMRGGNDAVSMSPGNHGFDVAGIQVVMGTGNDYLKIQNAKVTGRQATNLRMTQVGGVAGQSELGRDKLELDGFSTSTADTNIVMGGGNDKLHVLRSDCRGVGVGMIADAGDGVDEIKFAAAITALTVNGGKGNETFSLSGSYSNVTFNGGDGAERMSVKNVFILDRLTINAGNGADVLEMDDTQIERVTINMGASADRDVVTSKYLSCRDLTVNLGAGNNDLLTFSGRTAARNFSFNGGDGNGDTLQVVSGIKNHGTRSITGFEVKPSGF